MARVLQGFLGPFTGKVGGAVGGIWKGINYIKGYVIPANPNTVLQQAQRTKFRNVQQLAQSLLGTLILQLWNPFAVKMSGYNYFIQQFINSASSSGLALATSVVSKGGLEPASILTATYATATGDVVVTFDGTPQGNGLGSDSVGLLVLDKTTNDVLFYSIDKSIREDGTLTESLDSGLTATNLMFYIFCSRGTGSTYMVSNSVGQQAVAP